MKKFIMYTAVFLLAIATNLSAFDSAILETMLQVDCQLEQLDRSANKHDHHDNHHNKQKDYDYQQRIDGVGTSLHAPSNSETHAAGVGSTNWSGYVAVTNLQHPGTGTVTDVSGSWAVPSVLPSTIHTYSSFWVGIDGYSDGTVEQIGTEHDYVPGQGQVNYAWFEMYPQGAYLIVGFPVKAGDLMGAEVSYVSKNTFQLTLINYTKHLYTIIPHSYTQSTTALRSSAEWVAEAPSSSQGVLPLADFQHGLFSNCQATINGKTGSITNSHWADTSIIMETVGGTLKAVPSSTTSSGSTFIVSWDHS